MTMLDDKTATDLDIARQLARDGIPVFIAPPSDDPKDSAGFILPRNWHLTRADPGALDRWQPGWAVCLVTGHGLDLVDLDLYANEAAGALLEDQGLMPARYGVAATASGGVHVFVRGLGVASKNALMPGVDVKSGTPEGTGRGFAFIAPTVKKSKVTGQPAAYSWVMPPDAALAARQEQDYSGVPLAERIRQARRAGSQPAAAANGAGGGHQAPGPGEFMRISPWGDVKATLAAGRNDGVMRLAASLRGQGGWTLENALEKMRAEVWPLIDQSQGGHEFTEEEFEATIAHAFRAYPDGAEEALRQAEEHHAAAQEAAELHPPGSAIELSDSYLVRQVATWVLNDWRTGAPRMRWARGLGWMLWTRQVWLPVADGYVRNQLREFFVYWYQESVRAANAGAVDAAILAKMAGLLSKARITAVADLAHGYHETNPGAVECRHGLLTLRCANCSIMLDPAAFDAHPDLLNTPGGVVDLRTGEVMPHDPALLHTRITSGSYKPGFRHSDWDKALEALDASERAWFRQRIGQGITGHPPGDGIMVVMQGTGQNGKTACTTDGPVRALGDYASMASHKLISAATGNRGEHSTEIADLRGRRLLIGEELAEGRSIDVTALKRIQDVGKITARYVHRDNITFDASHTLLITTNYVPVINETDHGTWRRLALLKFPYTFRSDASQCRRPTDKVADPGLKQRIKADTTRQHDAIVTWAVDGAISWYKRDFADSPPTQRVTEDTQDWRAKADRILGFWQEKLEPDYDACILADDMREQFNRWLAENGHHEWAKEQFGARFAGHEETTRHGVESRRVKNPRGLIRWPVLGVNHRVFQAGAQHTVWTGVRPKDLVSTGSGGQVAGVAEQDVKLQDRSRIERFTSPSATPATASVPPSSVAVVAEPSAVSVQAPVVSTQTLLDPPATETPGLSLPVTKEPLPGMPEPGTDAPAPKARKAAKAPRAPGELTPAQARKAAEKAAVKATQLAAAEGPVHPLPVIVARDPAGGPPLVLSCTLDEARQAAEPALGALSVDVEHSGFPVGHPDYELRLVQLGDEQMAAVFDPADPAQRAVITDLVHRAGRLHAHSAIADLVPLAYAGLGDHEAMWAKMEDSVLVAKLADPALAGSDESQLKELAADLLGAYAVSKPAEVAKNTLFKAGGWLIETTALTPRERSGWAMVRRDCETFLRYAGADVLDLAAVLRVLPRPPAGG